MELHDFEAYIFVKSTTQCQTNNLYMHIMDGMQPSGVFIANIIIYFNNSP